MAGTSWPHGNNVYVGALGGQVRKIDQDFGAPCLFILAMHQAGRHGSLCTWHLCRGAHPLYVLLGTIMTRAMYSKDVILQDILIGAGKLKDEHTVEYSLPGSLFPSLQEQYNSIAASASTTTALHSITPVK